MNEKLKEELVNMAEEDTSVREELAADGSLFEGYNPTMEEVHNRNAQRLEEIIEEFGWPGKSLVGEDGAESAWLILQHAIGKPSLQRRGIELLKTKVDEGEVSKDQLAMLIDRVLFFEGKMQIYGTQFDWDENDELSPREIDNPEQVDSRRKQMGLSPIAETTKMHRERAEKLNEKPPKNRKEKQKEFEDWTKKVGWRG